MDLHDVAVAAAVLVGVGRAGTGLWFLTAAGRSARFWVGVADTPARCLVRAVGSRDLVLGVGILWALGADAAPLAWVLAATAADVADGGVAATMLPEPNRRKTVIAAWGFAALGVLAAVLLALD